MLKARSLAASFIVFAAFCAAAAAQVTGGAVPAPINYGDQVPPITVLYPADFAVYAPVTARDALDRLPGLEIVDLDGERGLGGGGNVLINGERAGGKSNTVLQQLDRISSASIIRVEVFAAATASFDASGSSQVINVVIDQSDGNISGTYGGNVEFSVREGLVYGDLNASANWTKGALTIDLAFRTDGDKTPVRGNELFGPVGLMPDIVRGERRLSTRRDYQFTGAVGWKFNPGQVLRVSAQGEFQDEGFFEATSDLFSDAGSILEDTLLNSAGESVDVEVTAEYERRIDEDLQLKFTALQSLSNQRDAIDIRDIASLSAVTLLGNANDARESILRGRAVWQASDKHLLTFQLEGAYNKLDANLFFAESPPGVPFGDIRDPANLSSSTLVQEYRGDAFVEDQWSFADKLVLTTRFAGEISNLQVSGSTDNSRTLIFPKPRVELAYQIRKRHRLEFSVERVIGQLDFFDFAANVSLADADERGSTGELQPQREWRSNATWEMQLPRRSGRTALTLFHAVVQDAIEPVPLTRALDETVDTIGNIGTGQRFGVEAEFSLRLGQWGLPDILLDGGFTVQKTSVEDPITGLNRRLRDERPFVWNVGYRHDISAWKLSYGGELSFRGRSRAFEINQLIDQRNSPSGEAFIESQMIPGMILRLRVLNILNRDQARERTIFSPNRLVDTLPSVEDRSRRIGRYVRFSVEGVF